MKVVILCGGLGTRLREETEFRPKPMVHIGSRPILWHIMKIFSHYGYKDFILALGYKGEMIKEYFYNYEALNNNFTIELNNNKQIKVHGNHDEAGWRITLVDTGEKALKGARLKRIEKYIETDTFMMTYGDGVANINIEELVKFHKKHGKLATVTGVNSASRFGELKIKGDMVEGFNEKADSEKSLISGGFFCFNKKFLDHLTDSDQCDLEIGPLEEISRQGELAVYRHEGFWSCMDTLRDTDYLNNLWQENKASWKIW